MGNIKKTVMIPYQPMIPNPVSDFDDVLHENLICSKNINLGLNIWIGNLATTYRHNLYSGRIPRSNIGQDTDRSAWCFSWFSSVYSGKSRDSTSIRNDGSLLDHYKFIYHPALYKKWRTWRRMEKRRYTSIVLNFDIRCRWVVSFTPGAERGGCVALQLVWRLCGPTARLEAVWPYSSSGGYTQESLSIVRTSRP
jgi:hypothetical protein